MAVEAAEDSALSSTEAEYMAAMEAGKEILWMKDFISELCIRQDEYRLYCDSQVPSTLLRTQRTIPGRSISSVGITGSWSE